MIPFVNQSLHYFDCDFTYDNVHFDLRKRSCFKKKLFPQKVPS